MYMDEFIAKGAVNTDTTAAMTSRSELRAGTGYVIFGVGIGNLGRTGGRRVPMGDLVAKINERLLAASYTARIASSFGHTGNFATTLEDSHDGGIVTELRSCLGFEAAILPIADVRPRSGRCLAAASRREKLVSVGHLEWLGRSPALFAAVELHEQYALHRKLRRKTTNDISDLECTQGGRLTEMAHGDGRPGPVSSWAHCGHTGGFQTHQGPTTCAVGPCFRWLRGLDLNQRPLGYEPNELPGCSTPR